MPDPEFPAYDAGEPDEADAPAEPERRQLVALISGQTADDTTRRVNAFFAAVAETGGWADLFATKLSTAISAQGPIWYTVLIPYQAGSPVGVPR